ncbi:MAG: hypothetical protein CMP06_13960 [Xanthomonadales bacterium]|nr:hypothetical protein [Xanthomonadales bacterium]
MAVNYYFFLARIVFARTRMQVIFEPCDIWRVVFVWIVQSGGCTVQNKKVGNKPDTTIRGGEVIIFEPVD